MTFGILFGNHRNLRSHLIECREDHFLRRPVGFGDREVGVHDNVEPSEPRPGRSRVLGHAVGPDLQPVDERLFVPGRVEDA